MAYDKNTQEDKTMNQVETLKDELNQAKERLPQIASEKEAMKQRLETAKNNHSRIESQVTTLRKERQDLLVDGDDVENVNARLKEVRKQDELLEDEIEGLTGKLSQLDNEGQNLAARTIEIKKQLVREETIRPLVAEYNELAPKLADILIQLDKAAHGYVKAFSSAGQRLIQSDSTGQYHNVRLLPGIWMYNETPIPEHYNRATVAGRLQKDDNERSIRAKYPDCRCFRCNEYLGVNDALTPSCNRLRGPIPHRLLTGPISDIKTPETERCLFKAREGKE